MMADGRSAPTCKKCEGTHYGYQACGTPEAVRAERKRVGSGAPLILHENLARRGLRPFGDRLETIDANGWIKGGVIRKRGGVIEHPDWSK